MANTPQSRKRARQNDRRRHHNTALRSMMRTQMKKVLKAVDAGDKSSADAAFKAAVPVIDRMADKDIIHKNTAARHKSRLNARVRALA